ncbi:MAG: hypothetical protein IIA44_15800, partial [Acidobacteria bacterium]|nr:hypothetical protein [Acidobacteriota bacterium]
GQTAIVEVYVTNSSGEVWPDHTVYLSASPSTGGTFSATVVQTDANGVATVTFTAVQQGAVVITARAEGAEVTKTKTVSIETGGELTALGQIVLTATPSLMQADGLSSAVIAANVYDSFGNPVADSTRVRFTSGEKFVDINGDGVWTLNVDSLVYDMDADDEWDAIGSIDDFAYTVAGRAVANFTSGNTAGLVYIKATVGEPGFNISDDISISLTSADSVHSIALTPEWQQIQVKATGGIEWARIMAEAYDAFGNPAPEGREIEFLITAGPGGGEDINGDPVGPVTVLTNSLGQAEITLNSGNRPGTVRLLARSGAVVSAATQVAVRSGPPAFISVGAEDCNVPSWAIVNYLNPVTALVVDQWGNEVADSTSVWFGTEQGLIEGEAATFAAFTFRGVAQSIWHSGAPKNDGYVYYWCETAGGTVADTSMFWESGLAGGGLYLRAPDTMWADGDSKEEVVIQVWDLNGVFMDTDTEIEVDADLGTISSGLLGDGCNSSIYATHYVAPTLDRDFMVTIPDSGIGAIATIKARVGGFFGFNGEAKVVLLTGTAYGKLSTVDMSLSVVYGTTVPIEVTILDRWGNPLGGHLIEIVDDGAGGTVTGSPKYTNEYGVASGFTFTATANQSVNSAFVTMNDLDPNFGGISKGLKIALEE